MPIKATEEYIARRRRIDNGDEPVVRASCAMNPEDFDVVKPILADGEFTTRGLLADITDPIPMRLGDFFITASLPLKSSIQVEQFQILALRQKCGLVKSFFNNGDTEF